jgi:molybdopterin-guanine dinucleotide biosynthesis protein A
VSGALTLPATLVILAGGEGRRMGRPKALLPVAGRTLIEWQLDRLAPHFAHHLIAVRSPEQVPAGLRDRVVCDPGGEPAGPLAGIQAGLAAAQDDVVLVVACDMPRVTPDLARRLVEAAGPEVDAVVPRLGGRPEPACAAYRAGAAGSMAAALRAGLRRATDGLAGLRVHWLDGESPELFANLNTPAEYHAFVGGSVSPGALTSVLARTD